MSEDEQQSAPLRRLTPLDIQQQRFRSVMRGFDRTEVLDFLALVRRELEELTRENRDLRESLQQERSQAERGRQQEEALRRAITTAQTMADDVVERARREAEVLQAEAQLKARQSTQSAREELAALKQQIGSLKQTRQRLKLSLRGVLEGHLRLLEAEEAILPDVPEAAPETEPLPQPVEAAPPARVADFQVEELEELPQDVPSEELVLEEDEVTTNHRRAPELARLEELRQRFKTSS